MVTTVKYISDHRNYRHELFMRKQLTYKVIMDCRATLLHQFGTRLGFKQYDIILSKGLSVIMKIKSSFVGENM